MFRKLLLSTAFIYASVATEAQPVLIDSVENNNIGRPCRVGEGNEMYTYYIKGADNARLKTATLVLNISAPGRQEPQQVSVPVDKNTNILSSAASNMGAIFLTYNTNTKASLLMGMDFAGNVIQKIPIDGITAEQAAWDNDIRLYSVMPEGYLMVLPDAKKGSYTISAYGADMKELWKEKFEGRHNTLEVTDARMMGENFFVLRREQIDAKQQKYTYSLQVMNMLNHSANSIHELKDKNNNYCYATALNDHEGQVQVAGLCYKDGKFVQGLPAGIAIYEYDINGTEVRSVFVDGQQLGKFLPDPVIAAMATNSVLNVTGLVCDNAQNIYGLVAEMMEKKETDTKKQEAKINIGDMITMVVTKDGEMQKLAMADKPPHMAVSLKGSPAAADINTTAVWLQKNKLFNTKFIIRLGDGFYICTKSTDTTKHETDAIFIKLDEPNMDSRFTMAITRTPSTDLALMPICKVNVVAGTTDKKIKRWQQADVYNTTGAQVVFYNQADNKIIMHFDAVMKRNEK